MWLLVALGCGAAGPCDRRELSGALNVGASIDERMRSEFAAAALADTCPRLDPAMVAGLAELQGSDPSYRRLMEMKLIADHPQWWVAACPAGTQVLADAIAVSPSDFAPLIHERCALDQLGFSAGDLGGDGYPLAAIVVRKALRDAGAPEFESTQLTRMLAQ